MLYILCYILCSTFYVIFYVRRGQIICFMKGHRVLKRVILKCKCYADAPVTQQFRCPTVRVSFN